MSNSFKTLYLSVIVLTFSACYDEPPTRYTQAGLTNVTVTEISSGSQPIQIKATAVGYDGCWNNLKFELSQQDDFQYTLKSYAFVSGNTCPQVLVSKDTVLSFMPEKSGTYTLNIYESYDKKSLKYIKVNK